MKRIVAALIVVIMCFMLSACSFPTYKTPLMWCVLDVLHNEPYDDGEAVDVGVGIRRREPVTVKYFVVGFKRREFKNLWRLGKDDLFLCGFFFKKISQRKFFCNLFLLFFTGQLFFSEREESAKILCGEFFFRRRIFFNRAGCFSGGKDVAETAAGRVFFRRRISAGLFFV